MRRSIAVIPLFLLGLAGLSAEIIPMIELSKDDAAKAQAVFDALAQASEAYGKLEQQMYRGYVKDSNTKGFPLALYSADFRFLVGAGDPAPLLALSPEDTAQLQAAYNSYVQAQQDADAFHHHILEAYVAVRGSERAALSFGDPPVPVPAERAVFQRFRFSQDYRFILPQ